EQGAQSALPSLVIQRRWPRCWQSWGIPITGQRKSGGAWRCGNARQLALPWLPSVRGRRWGSSRWPGSRIWSGRGGGGGSWRSACLPRAAGRVSAVGLSIPPRKQLASLAASPWRSPVGAAAPNPIHSTGTSAMKTGVTAAHATLKTSSPAHPRSATCSPAMREAADSATGTYRRTSGPHSPKAPSRAGVYRPEHIPALLEQHWHDEHLASLGYRGTTTMRRAGSVLLVQWASGGSLGDAARYLGIGLRRSQHSFGPELARWLRGNGIRDFFGALL